MNNERRKSLKMVVCAIDDIVNDLTDIRNEEQDAYDNLPEGLQESERGEQIWENVDAIDSIIADLENAADEIDELISN